MDEKVDAAFCDVLPGGGSRRDKTIAVVMSESYHTVPFAASRYYSVGSAPRNAWSSVLRETFKPLLEKAVGAWGDQDQVNCLITLMMRRTGCAETAYRP